MNILCPIFPEGFFEADLLWKPFNGEPYIDHVLRRLRSEENVRLNILTNHQELYRHLSGEGLDVFFEGSADNTDPGGGAFAHFRLPSLKKRLGDMFLDDTGEVVLLDIRYPLVTYPVINEALSQYRRSKKAVVVSVSRPVDHPAQVETFFTHVGTDILSMIDTGFDIDRFVEDAVARYGVKIPAPAFSGVSFSKPFFFNWAGYGIRPEVYDSIVYRVFDEGQHSWARPCSDAGSPGHPDRQSVGKYYLFESDMQARRLYASLDLKTSSGNEIWGFSFSRNPGRCICLLSGEKDGTSGRVCLNEAYVGNGYLMRIEPKTASPLEDSAAAVLVDIDRHIAGMPVLEAMGVNFHETDIRLGRMIPGDHWVVSILENVSSGTADMSQPIQLGNAPWYTDPRTKRRFDPATKRELTGRQLLPPVYRLEDAFLVTGTPNVSKLESEIDVTNAEGFVLSDSISRKITSRIDFLKIPGFYKERENGR